MRRCVAASHSDMPENEIPRYFCEPKSQILFGVRFNNGGKYIITLL